MLASPRYRHILRGIGGIVSLDDRQYPVIALITDYAAEHINIGVRCRNGGAPADCIRSPVLLAVPGLLVLSIARLFAVSGRVAINFRADIARPAITLACATAR